MTAISCACGFKGNIKIYRGSYCDPDNKNHGLVPTISNNWRTQFVHCPLCGCLTKWLGTDLEEVYLPDNYSELIHNQVNVWGVVDDI